MRVIILLLACVLLLFAGHKGAQADYIGGTRADIPADSSGEIQVSDQVYFIFVSKQTRVQIPYERINLIEYGQKVDRRYLEAVVISPLFMLSKKRQHFLTIGFQDDDGHQQALVFKVSKKDIRLTLVTLEAHTGQEVRFQDEEARIAGKG
ncbi:MAG TPA: hypothetical protein VH369_04575 [Bryobacteraceae bacterium]|jgi:hypothetical protein